MATSDKLPSNAARRTQMTKAVFIDGINKGEVFKRAGRWFWRRGEVAVEPFAKGSSLAGVAEWARKCCNGRNAEVRELAKQPKPPRGPKNLKAGGFTRLVARG